MTRRDRLALTREEIDNLIREALATKEGRAKLAMAIRELVTPPPPRPLEEVFLDIVTNEEE